MASQQQLQFAIRAVNEASKALKDVEGDIGKVGRAADEAEKKSGGFGKALGGIGTVAGGILAAGALSKLGGFMTSAAQAALEEEAATRRLHQTFKNYADMVGATPGTFEALNGLLNERIDIGQKLAFTDDEIRNSFNALLTATDDSTQATLRQTTAMDLARGAGIPLETASKMLGKITAENVEVFKKMGITIGENATEADALAAVQARFGGQAEAYAQSTAGQFAQTSIRMGELKEQIGMQLLPIMTKMGTLLVEEVIPRVEQFANYFQANVVPKIKAFADDASAHIRQFIDFAMPYLVKFSDFAKEQFAKFQGYYQSDLKPAFDNISKGVEAVVKTFIDNWEKIEPVVIPILNQIANVVENTVTTIKLALGIVVDLLGGDFSGAWEKAKDLVELQVQFIKDSVGNLVDFVQGLVPLILEAATAVGGAIKDGLVAGISAAGGFAQDIGQSVLAAIKSLLNSQVIDKLNAMSIHIAIPHAPDIDIPFPDIPHLAAGGIVTRPTLALIGEAGPEAVVPLSGNRGGFSEATIIIQAWDGDSVETWLQRGGADKIRRAMSGQGAFA